MIEPSRFPMQSGWSIIQAVVQGDLIPIGRAKQFPGIMGYSFRRSNLRPFHDSAYARPSPQGLLRYGEAAAMLETTREVIGGLVASGRFTKMRPPRGFWRLVLAREVRLFAN